VFYLTGLRKRIRDGIFAGVFGQLVNLIIQFCSVPLFLHFWGVETYGDWLVLTSFVSFFSLTHLGFGAVSGNDMTMSVAKGDREGALVTFQSMILLTIVVSLLVTSIVSLLLAGSPLLSLLPIGRMDSSDCMNVLVLSTATVFIGQINGIISNGYRCDGNFALGSVLNGFGRLFSWIAQALALALTEDPTWIVASSAITSFLWCFPMGIILVRLSPWIKFGVRNSSYQKIKSLSRPAIGQLAFPLGDSLNTQGMLQIVASAFGPTYAAIFVTHRTLANVTSQFLNLINGALLPELSRLHGEQDLRRLRLMHRVSCFFAIWGSAVVGVTLLCSANRILDIWTSGRIEVNFALFTGCVIALIGRSLWLTSSSIFYSCNRHVGLGLRYLLVVTAGVIIAAGAIPSLGQLVVPGVLIVSELVMVVNVTTRAIRMMNENKIEFLRSLFDYRAVLSRIVQRR
jgi:O-antigen/teichoic acid export membrane protein